MNVGLPRGKKKKKMKQGRGKTNCGEGKNPVKEETGGGMNGEEGEDVPPIVGVTKGEHRNRIKGIESDDGGALS